MCEQDTRKIINEIRASFGAPPTTMTDEQIEAGREVYGAKLDYDMAVIDEVQDTRERLEADVHQYANPSGYKNTLGASWEKKMLSFLDRQAAITEREVKLRELYKFEENHRESIDATEEVNRKLNERIDELTEERDQMQAERAGLENVLVDICDLKAENMRLRESIDAMGNGQFYAMYLKACEERDHFKDLAITKQTK